MPAGAAASVATPIMDAALVACVAMQAGFTGHQLQLAVAIAMAESNGNAGDTGTNTDSHKYPDGHTRASKDRGLWQINDYWHPEVSDDCAYNPTCAARQAFRISDGGKSWGAWATFTSGAYLAHMPDAAAGIATVHNFGSAAQYAASQHRNLDYSFKPGGGFPGSHLAGEVAGAVTAPLAWGEAFAKLLGNLTNPGYILRGVELVAGVSLMGVGLLIVARSVAGDAVTSAVGAAAPSAPSAPSSAASTRSGGASTAAASKGASSAAKSTAATAAETAAV